MRRILLTTLLMFASAACSTADSAPADTTTSTPAPATSTTTTTAPPVDNQIADNSPCLAGDRTFASSGVIGAFGATRGDAAQISAIRWADHPGCERVVIDLLTADGAPAGASGAVGVDYDETLGIVRVNLPSSIAKTAIADSRLDGDLVDRTYVVKTASGRMAVDIHVTKGAAVSVRAFEVSNPSRIVVDIKPNEAASPVTGVTQSRDLVVISPQNGRTDPPIALTGYTRAFEALVIARLHADIDSPAIVEQSATAADWTEMWGEFEILFVDPPKQQMSLFVGTEAPGSGDLDGVWVEIDTTALVVDPPPPDS